MHIFNDPTATPPPMSQGQATNSVRLSRLLGLRVINQFDVTLGTIADFVLDINSGKLMYAALVSGSFLPIHDKYFAVPCHALVYIPQTNSFLLHLDKKLLDEDPGFDKKNWPDIADSKWANYLCMYYST